MSALAKIHIAKKQLGLEDDDYRALLARTTGKSSLRAMSTQEHVQVIKELERIGFKPRHKIDGPYAKKLQALWLSAYNLGIVENPSDEAMLGFIKRQTGIEHTRFLRDAADAKKAVEALKGWMAREAGVDWSVSNLCLPWQNDERYKVLAAQARRLQKLGFTGTVASEPIYMACGKITVLTETALEDASVELQKVAGRLIRERQKEAQ
jgi:phage gp16-like protein